MLTSYGLVLTIGPSCFTFSTMIPLNKVGTLTIFLVQFIYVDGFVPLEQVVLPHSFGEVGVPWARYLGQRTVHGAKQILYMTSVKIMK